MEDHGTELLTWDQGVLCVDWKVALVVALIVFVKGAMRR